MSAEQFKEPIFALVDVVEPLVDSIASLILSGVTSDFTEVRSAVEGIAKYTEQVVLIAQKLALQSDDPDIQVAMTNAINTLAGSIEGLVVGFNQLIADQQSEDAKRGFATAAKNVGDAIQDLVTATDETQQEKLLKLIAIAREKVGVMRAAIKISAIETGNAARVAGQAVVTAVKYCDIAEQATSNKQKKKLINDAAKHLKAVTASAIKASTVASADKSQVSQAVAALKDQEDAFIELEAAAKISADELLRKLREIMEEVERLLAMAKALKRSAVKLVQAARAGDVGEMTLHAKEAARGAMSLAESATNALSKIDDPHRRMQVSQAIDELKALSSDLIAKARHAAENPDDPEAQRAVAEAYAKMQAAVDKVVNLMNPNYDLSEKARYTSEDLMKAGDKMADAARRGDQAEMVAAAREFAAMSKLMQKDLLEMAEREKNPAKKQALLDAADAIGELTGEYIQDAKAVLVDPQDEEKRRKLDTRQKEFNNTVIDTQVDAGLEPTREKMNEAEVDEFLLNQAIESGDIDEAMRRSRKAAGGARRAADSAASAAAKIDDPHRRAQAQGAVDEVRAAAQELDDAIAYLAAHPNDPAAQRRVKEAYARLNKAEQKMKDLLDPSLPPKDRARYTMEDFLQAGDAMAEAARRGDEQEMLNAARQFAALSKVLAADLRAMAALESDPVKKQALLDAADRLEEMSGEYIRDAKSVLLNPDDEKAKLRLDLMQAQLQNTVVALQEDNDIAPTRRIIEESTLGSTQRTLEQLELEEAERAYQEQLEAELAAIDDSELVQAAKKQVSEALSLADEAMALAESIEDPQMRAQMIEAAMALKKASDAVVDAAVYASANPDDPEAQAKLDAAQKHMADCIRNVVEVSTRGQHKDQELEAAMMQFESQFEEAQHQQSSQVFAEIDSMMSEIKSLMSTTGDDPKEHMAKAKSVAGKAANLSKMLREMAKTIDDPVLKANLVEASKVVRDRGVRVKILSAVAVAGGDDSNGQVEAALGGLQSEISEVENSLRAGMLKARLHRTKAQGSAISGVLTAWKKQNGLKK